MSAGRQAGYTLVELLVVIAIFSVVTGLITVSFNRIVTGSGQLLKSTETEIGGLIGLELMRVDLELAGFGLPWSLPDEVNYTESKTHIVDGIDQTNSANFNDGNDNPVRLDGKSYPPRAFITLNNQGINNSDYLVLKGSALGMTMTSRAWSYLNYSSKGKPPGTELNVGDKVVIVNSGVRGNWAVRTLIAKGSSFALDFDLQERLPKDFQSQNREDRYLVYGISAADSGDVISFPFNRADYYLGPPSDPRKFSAACAPGTKVLYRGKVAQNGIFSAFPVLDCVGDLQVMFFLDSDGSGTPNDMRDDTSGLSAQEIREQLKEVRVYILAQQGQRDPSYTYPAQEILVGEERYRTWGSSWDQRRLIDTFGPDWMHYRWKLYTIVVQPKNLE